MRFHFDAKRHLTPLFALFLIMVILGTISIIISYTKTDSSFLKQGVLLFEFALVFLLGLIYGYGYSVDIKEDELIIRLCYIRKKYNLFDLKEYKYKENKHFATFFLYFVNKKRTITTIKKDELIQILDQYTKEKI